MGFGDTLRSIGNYGLDALTLGALQINPDGSIKTQNPFGAGGLLGPTAIDTSPGTAAIKNSAGLQNQFGGLAGAFQSQYLPQSDAALAGNQQLQNANIAMLQKYATGAMPSPAELQLREQAAANARNAYGTAAALGARTPGAGLDAALRSAQQTNATANQQAAVQRASDTAQAQSALTGALANQGSQLATQRGQTLGNIQNLYGNQLAAGGQQVTGAGNEMSAQAQAAQAANAMKGGLLSAGGQALAAASDEREKTNVKPIGGNAFDRLADAFQGFTFEYKHPGEVEGEHPGERIGGMAQDALKGGPAGKAMVSKGTDGVLRLDPANALGAALAMSAEALRRTKKPQRSAGLAGAFGKAA